MEKITLIEENKDQRVYDPKNDLAYTLTNIQSKKRMECKGKCELDKEGVHPIYKVEFEEDSFYAGLQLIEDVDILNFRDLGGYFTEDGRQVKYHTFYRSSPIQFKNEKSIEAFKQLQMHTILDFRSEDEIESSKDDILEGVSYVHIGAINDDEFDGSFDMAELLENGDVDSLTNYMTKIYQLLPFKNPAYQKMFELMLNEEVPFVFHCSAGKDRTGFGAYLILRSLGVSHDVALADYLMSNTYLYENNQKLMEHFKVEGADTLFCISEAYLNEAIQKIHEKYDSFDSYLKHEYGLDETKRNRLKELYLYEG